MRTVLVTISGPVGCGKSALAGEIEILCKALGLQVEWVGGQQEKNLTHADWTSALELYKPAVRIVETIDGPQRNPSLGQIMGLPHGEGVMTGGATPGEGK